MTSNPDIGVRRGQLKIVRGDVTTTLEKSRNQLVNMQNGQSNNVTLFFQLSDIPNKDWFESLEMVTRNQRPEHDISFAGIENGIALMSVAANIDKMDEAYEELTQFVDSVNRRYVAKLDQDDELREAIRQQFQKLGLDT